MRPPHYDYLNIMLIKGRGNIQDGLASPVGKPIKSKHYHDFISRFVRLCVRVSVCVCVHVFTFEVLFKRLFTPTS